MKATKIYCVAALALVALLLALPTARGFTFEVEAHKVECFYESVPIGAPVNIRYQVIKGGFLDVDVNMYDPNRRLIYEAERETEGSFAFSAESNGDYQICFSNRMSTLTPKTVSMFVIVGKAPKKGANAALEPLEAEIRQISQGVEELKNGQNYLKNREMASRDTSESTNGRVLMFSVVEALALIAVSAYQIHSLKSFFEVKRTI
ncbi:copii-coated vesicle membrane protein P24, putative [Acanthamoeba castellanii str. Neff]|uniref:Copii-coated vesicle membrane protein P24, putative n=1 Tax=Acanthamoeba castellanii (strain ATCC 30010 / Neff) TaxID=1257118 RepID=L8H622_ACACF|nr:copii-coated vesicle membrane protein P24, putative [Acanthamoeba castellanii str. Neff]ELR20662.1 copii-coated vesicle membrane protein P24, putative [Acanthamoeba castellanii str. Neff]